MERGLILKHTETIAAELAQQFAGNLKGELDCWVSTAQQREEMVVQIYNALNLKARIPDQPGTEGATAVTVREVIASIWAQEASHATLMGKLRVVDQPGGVQLQGVQGKVEGLMTSWATSNGALGTIARAAIGAARAFNAAPEFTGALGAMSLGDFFLFSAELEQTAKNGYRRIIQLLEELQKAGQPSAYGRLAQYEFATTLAEESFHQAIFERMGGWLKKGNRELEAIPEEKAAAAIESLVNEHLVLRKVQGLPRHDGRGEAFLEADGDAVISDGGLGHLLGRLNVPFRVARKPAA
jgi:hypothetical protein